MWKKLSHTNLSLSIILILASLVCSAQRAELISKETEWYFGSVNEGCPREFIHIYYEHDTIINGQEVLAFHQDRYKPNSNIEKMDTFYFYADTISLYAWDKAISDFRTIMHFEYGVSMSDVIENNEPTDLPWYSWGNTQLECPPQNCRLSTGLIALDTIEIDGYPVIIQTYDPHSTLPNNYAGEFAQYIGFWKTGVFNFFNYNMDFWGTCDPLLMCFSNEHFTYKNFDVSCDTIDDWLTSTESLAAQNKVDIKMYPNPVLSDLNIISENSFLQSVIVFNLSGSEVFTYSFGSASSVSEYQLDVSHLPRGVYTVKIKTQKKHVVRKLIKK